MAHASCVIGNEQAGKAAVPFSSSALMPLPPISHLHIQLRAKLLHVVFLDTMISTELHDLFQA